MQGLLKQLSDISFIVCLTLFVIVVGSFIVHVEAEVREKERFMVQCVKDYPEYKCMAMWRARR